MTRPLLPRISTIMKVSLTLVYVCRCGTMRRGVLVHTVRVIRGHLRILDRGVGVLPTDCPCGHPFTATELTRVDLEGDDLIQVNAVRAAKRWPSWDGCNVRVRAHEPEVRQCSNPRSQSKGDESDDDSNSDDE